MPVFAAAITHAHPNRRQRKKTHTQGTRGERGAVRSAPTAGAATAKWPVVRRQTPAAKCTPQATATAAGTATATVTAAVRPSVSYDQISYNTRGV